MKWEWAAYHHHHQCPRVSLQVREFFTVNHSAHPVRGQCSTQRGRHQLRPQITRAEKHTYALSATRGKTAAVTTDRDRGTHSDPKYSTHFTFTSEDNIHGHVHVRVQTGITLDVHTRMIRVVRIKVETGVICYIG